MDFINLIDIQDVFSEIIKYLDLDCLLILSFINSKIKNLIINCQKYNSCKNFYINYNYDIYDLLIGDHNVYDHYFYTAINNCHMEIVIYLTNKYGLYIPIQKGFKRALIFCNIKFITWYYNKFNNYFEHPINIFAYLPNIKNIDTLKFIFEDLNYKNYLICNQILETIVFYNNLNLIELIIEYRNFNSDIILKILNHILEYGDSNVINWFFENPKINKILESNMDVIIKSVEYTNKILIIKKLNNIMVKINPSKQHIFTNNELFELYIVENQYDKILNLLDNFSYTFLLKRFDDALCGDNLKLARILSKKIIVDFYEIKYLVPCGSKERIDFIIELYGQQILFDNMFIYSLFRNQYLVDKYMNYIDFNNIQIDIPGSIKTIILCYPLKIVKWILTKHPNIINYIMNFNNYHEINLDLLEWYIDNKFVNFDILFKSKMTPGRVYHKAILIAYENKLFEPKYLVQFISVNKFYYLKLAKLYYSEFKKEKIPENLKIWLEIKN